MHRPASASPISNNNNSANAANNHAGEKKRASLAYLSVNESGGGRDESTSPDPFIQTSFAMRKLSNAFGLFSC
jgi:hypothetical protein